MNTRKIIRDISNSMQDAVKLGNVKRPKRENKEVKVEKKIQSNVNNFSFYREVQK